MLYLQPVRRFLAKDIISKHHFWVNMLLQLRGYRAERLDLAGLEK